VTVDTPEITPEAPAPVAAFALAGADAGLPPPPTNPRVINEGKTCIKKGTYVYAVYASTNNSDSGVKTVEPVLVGSNWGKITARDGKVSNYDCMGKCGAACGIGGGYTKDCLDHDTCSFRFKAAGGKSDPNCGDEYNQAADDILNSCSTN
jgi:hypothetical protein